MKQRTLVILQVARQKLAAGARKLIYIISIISIRIYQTVLIFGEGERHHELNTSSEYHDYL